MMTLCMNVVQNIGTKHGGFIMENNNETIKLVFPPAEENITWTKRKPRLSIDKKNSVNISEKISKLDFDPNVKASIKTDCVFCKKMIETSEYVKHLQEDHPLEYQAMCKNIKSVKKTTTSILNNGKTARGIEIQGILSNIQEETKRKDLNLIEKENLQKILLGLQKEMTDEIEKFSK